MAEREQGTAGSCQRPEKGYAECQENLLLVGWFATVRQRGGNTDSEKSWRKRWGAKCYIAEFLQSVGSASGSSTQGIIWKARQIPPAALYSCDGFYSMAMLSRWYYSDMPITHHKIFSACLMRSRPAEWTVLCDLLTRCRDYAPEDYPNVLSGSWVIKR